MGIPATIEERRLGEASGLAGPGVGMGTWQTLDVRGRRAERHAHEIVAAALDAGARFLDTSPMYGEAERVLGEALSGDRRADAIVATKVWTPDDAEAERQVQRALGWYGGRGGPHQGPNPLEGEKRPAPLEHARRPRAVLAVGAPHHHPPAVRGPPPRLRR